ncbi:hypothetical protein [Streptomyces sp. NPDC126503]|uniref:hypothetical protein n=1 Tax=Streptomyces sp. NPDC126503 TaxID=3155315 RepID=UPI003331075B
MKYSYKATRGDKKALCRDAKPDTHLYVINTHTDRGQTYSEWVVIKELAFEPGVRMVQCPTTGAKTSLTQLLASAREVFGQRPAGMPNRAAPVRSDAYGDFADFEAGVTQEFTGAQARRQRFLSRR